MGARIACLEVLLHLMFGRVLGGRVVANSFCLFLFIVWVAFVNEMFVIQILNDVNFFIIKVGQFLLEQPFLAGLDALNLGGIVQFLPILVYNHICHHVSRYILTFFVH